MAESEPKSAYGELEQYRDPQIDELVDVLRLINLRLHSLNSIHDELAGIRLLLARSSPPGSWREKVFGWFRRRSLSKALRKQERERNKHMHDLAKNAPVVNSGRFRSRY